MEILVLFEKLVGYQEVAFHCISFVRINVSCTFFSRNQKLLQLLQRLLCLVKVAEMAQFWHFLENRRPLEFAHIWNRLISYIEKINVGLDKSLPEYVLGNRLLINFALKFNVFILFFMNLLFFVVMFRVYIHLLSNRILFLFILSLSLLFLNHFHRLKLFFFRQSYIGLIRIAHIN